MQKTTILAKVFKISILFLCISLSSQQMPLYAEGNSPILTKQAEIVSANGSNMNRGTGSSIAGSGPMLYVEYEVITSMGGNSVNRGTGSSIAGSGPLLNVSR